jgi:hypothetical protein
MPIDQKLLTEAKEAVGHLGKYEAEPLATVYFHMAGIGDETLILNGYTYEVFEVDAEERAVLEIEQPFFAVHEDDQGFAWGEELSEEELSRARQQELEEAAEEEADGYQL